MKARPGIFARRAVHQYRRRDILAYASLRLYLRNNCALRDRWANEIARALLLDQSQPIYNHLYYFKQIDKKGCCEFRDLYIPGPNEILAETALLGACAEKPKVFQPPSGVYSYELSAGSDTKGVYKYYFYGFHDRHRAIARACRKQSDAVVLHSDIRRYYPSVKIDMAKEVWNLACKEGNLHDDFRLLGVKLLDSYEQVNRSDPSLLIGPMFSHLIGNLVLRDIDLKMSEAAPRRYHRYVDDFVLVAPKEEAEDLEAHLECLLNEKGLELHKDKRIEVPARKWLRAESSLDGDESRLLWRNFIGGLKLLMLFRPAHRNMMERKLRNVGIRIRPLDYSEVRQDWGYLSRIRALLSNGWRRTILRGLSQERVIQEGLQLRSNCMEELKRVLSNLPDSSEDPFGRKMSISRLRFILSRLKYLAAPDKLLTIAKDIGDIEEVAIYVAIFEALANGDVTDLLKFGSAASQSIAQPLKMHSQPVKCSRQDLTKVESQAYAMLLLHDVTLKDHSGLPQNPMMTFCQGGNDVTELFESSDMYFRELSCLHGLNEPDVLRWSLNTAFDPDEEMAVDMLEMMQESYWF